MDTDRQLTDLLDRVAPDVDPDAAWVTTRAEIERDRRRRGTGRAVAIAASLVVLALVTSVVVASRRSAEVTFDTNAPPSAPPYTLPPPTSAPSNVPNVSSPVTASIPRTEGDLALPDVIDLRCAAGGGSVTPRARTRPDGVHFRFHGPSAAYTIGPAPDGSSAVLTGGDASRETSIDFVIPNVSYTVSCQTSVNDPSTRRPVGAVEVIDPQQFWTPTIEPTCETYGAFVQDQPLGNPQQQAADLMLRTVGRPVDVTMTGYADAASRPFTGRLDGRVIATGRVTSAFGVTSVSASPCVEAPYVPSLSDDPADTTVPTAADAVRLVREQSGGAPAPTRVEAKFTTPGEIKKASGDDRIGAFAPDGEAHWFVVAETPNMTASGGPQSRVYIVRAAETPHPMPLSLDPITDWPTWWAAVPDHA